MRRLGAAGISVAGTVLVVGLVLAVNATSERPDGEGVSAAVSFEVAPPPKKPPPARKQRKKKKTSNRDLPPAPVIAANLGGLGFGLDSLAGVGLGSDVDALLGDVRDVVMTEDTVDEGPRPLTQAPPDYPPRARKKGTTGLVTLSLLVGLDGAVQDARVLESRPPGIFDEAALSAVSRWTFRPAMYEGRPVAIRVTQALRFGFEG